MVDFVLDVGAASVVALDPFRRRGTCWALGRLPEMFTSALRGRVQGVQIGVVYPQIELGGDPTAVRRFGRAVEELGFDYLLAYDHVLGAVHAGRAARLTGPYTERDPFHDSFVMFAYLAGITERIGFATGVLILPQRQTALVARQAADVDLLSGGRLRLGVGVGWSPVEYQALGQDFRTRGARQEEQIDLLRRLFTDPVVDFAGRFDRVDRAALIPKPTRPSPSGSEDSATRHSTEQPASATASSSSAAASTTPPTPGTGSGIWCASGAGRLKPSAASMWCCPGVRSTNSPPRSTRGNGRAGHTCPS